MEITRDPNFHVICMEDDGGSLETQSVQAVLLYEILQVLKEIKEEVNVLTILSNDLTNDKKGGE